MSSDTVTKVRRLLLINSLIGFENFFAPVVILFYTSRLDISMGMLAVYFSVMTLTAWLLEIPSGLLSDKCGRKEVYLTGRGLYILGMLGIIFVPVDYVLFNFILFGFGNALASGNLQSIVYSMLKECRAEKYYGEIVSSCSSIGFESAAVCAILGGFLASYNLVIPVVIDTILMFLSCAVFIYYTRGYPKKLNASQVNDTFGKSILSDGVGDIFSNRNLLLIIIFSVSTFSFLRSAYNLYQPIFTEQDLPVEAFGIAFAAMNLVASAGAKRAMSVSAVLVERPLLTVGVFLIPFLLATLNLIAGQHVVIIFLMLISQQLLRGFEGPFSGTLINNYITADNSRTTVFSVVNFLRAIICSIFMLIVGYFTDYWGVNIAMFIISALFVVLVAVSQFWFKKRSIRSVLEAS